jgi:hypothetical protein
MPLSQLCGAQCLTLLCCAVMQHCDSANTVANAAQAVIRTYVNAPTTTLDTIAPNLRAMVLCAALISSALCQLRNRR